MGKASRRRTAGRELRGPAGSRDPGAQPAPFVARPFAGLPGETDWVALREVVPAATATVRFAPEAAPGDAPQTATVATVLPLAWSGLRRVDGEVLVGLQSGTTTGDASRDLAQVLLLTAAAEPGTPVPSTPLATAGTPRLQDVLDLAAPFEVTVHEGFDFWVTDAQELDAEGKDSLERANASAIPTTKLDAADSAYWCRIGERTHLRWVLPHDEDAATDALARLHARGASTIGDDTRLLGRVPRLRPARPGLGAGPDAGGRGLRGRGRRAGRPVRRRARGRGAADAGGAAGPRGPAEPPDHPALTGMDVPAGSVVAVIPAKDEAARIARDRRRRRRPSRGSTSSSSSTTAAPTRTSDLARAAGAVVVRHPRNRGKAAAMTTGAGLAALHDHALPSRSGQPRHLLFVDADLEASAANLGVLVPPVAAGTGRHDDRDPAAAADLRRRARLRRPPGARRDRRASPAGGRRSRCRGCAA